MPRLRGLLCNLLRSTGLLKPFAGLLLPFVRFYQCGDHMSRPWNTTSGFSHSLCILTQRWVLNPRLLQSRRSCGSGSFGFRCASGRIEGRANLLSDRSASSTLTAIGLIGKARTERAVLGDQHLLEFKRSGFVGTRVNCDDDVLSAVLLDDRAVVRVSPVREVPCTTTLTLADIEHATVGPRVRVSVETISLRHP